MLQITPADRGGSDDKRTVSNRFGNGFVLFSIGQHRCGAHRGTSLAECRIEWGHDPQPPKAEVAHGPSSLTNVERIARVHQDDA
jgi:hypothetical protein